MAERVIGKNLEPIDVGALMGGTDKQGFRKGPGMTPEQAGHVMGVNLSLSQQRLALHDVVYGKEKK